MRGSVPIVLLAMVLTSCTGSASVSSGSVVATSRPSPTATAEDATTDRPEVVEVLSPDTPALTPVDGDTFVNPGAVVRHGGQWWALANSFTSFPGPARTHLLVSDDLVGWEPASPDAVLTSAHAGRPDDAVFLMSAVRDDGGGWVGFLHVFAGAGQPTDILRATAPDLAGPWIVDADPVLVPGPPGTWSAERLAEPEVVRAPDGRWLLWYVGHAEDGRAAIGLATSADGRVWTPRDDPVLTGDQGWTRGTVDGPQVVATEDGFVMAYAAAERGAGQVGLAFSTDGVDWEPWAGNPVVTAEDLPERAGMFQNALVTDGDDLVLLQESGVGARDTVVHAVRIDLPAVRTADLPLLEVAARVDGPRVTVEVEIPGRRLSFDPDDATSLHPHVYVDLPPPPAGASVPLGRDAIVHARGSTLVVDGLSPGPHDLWVVLADGRDAVVELPVAIRVPVTIPDRR